MVVMRSPARPRRAALLAVVVSLLAALLATAPGPAAQAADDKGLANGAIKFPQRDQPALKMLWFDKNWSYLGQRSLGKADGYSLWLSPGTYHLQFVDQRPAYDVTKYAPTDIQVTVRANDITTKTVTMWKGAAITGTAKAGGKPLGGARLVAANKTEQSFATTANSKGQFAIGGLPQGQYSVFTYDKRKQWVGKSIWAGSVKPGQGKNVDIALTTKAGSMTVYLFTPAGRLRNTTPVTVMSKQTGQWWTGTARNGTAVFKGLYPGAYTMKFDGAGVWFARTGSVLRASVKPGQMAFGKFDITQRGGWITGNLVDAGAPDVVLDPAYDGAKGALLRLFNKAGDEIASTYSGADGYFVINGQLATQSGLTIVVQPGPNSGGYMRGEGYCHFDSREFADVELTTGEETYVGDLAIPRTADQKDPACASESPAARGGRGARR